MTLAADRSRRWRENNPAKSKASTDAWKKRNPDKLKQINGTNSARLVADKYGMARRMIYKARERGREKVTVCAADVLAVWPADDTCPVFGAPFFYGPRPARKPHDSAPSLDRIDPAGGYVVGNIAVISWRANALKRDGSLLEFVKLVRWMEGLQ